MLLSFAADDPDACTRFSVTLAPATLEPATVARTVGEVVAGCAAGARREDVEAAVHDVLTTIAGRAGGDLVRLRVRQRDETTEIELLERDPLTTSSWTGPLEVARASTDDLRDEATDAGHVVRLIYRS